MIFDGASIVEKNVPNVMEFRFSFRKGIKMNIYYVIQSANVENING